MTGKREVARSLQYIKVRSRPRVAEQSTEPEENKMQMISRDKKKIAAILKAQDIDMDLEGLQIQRYSNGTTGVTMPAPAGETAHYHAKTNTGGRRFVCWA